jgi:hypothetical protein
VPRSASASMRSTNARNDVAMRSKRRARSTQPQAIGERLLAGRPERDAGMSAHRLKQYGDRLGNRALIAPCVESRHDDVSIGHLLLGRIKLTPIDGMHWIQPTEARRSETAGGLLEGLLLARINREPRRAIQNPARMGAMRGRSHSLAPRTPSSAVCL